jgi:hypothetical protein
VLSTFFVSAKPAGMCEDDRAVPSDVFVEQDASLGIAQESRQSCLAFEKRAIAQNHPLAIATTYAEPVAAVGERRFCFARGADDALAWSSSLFWSRFLMASANRSVASSGVKWPIPLNLSKV